jgi:type IV secretory pathway VirB3-like protein
VSSDLEPEGWQAECWSALYQPTLIVGVPWRMASISMVCWISLGFGSRNIILCFLLGIAFHWLLKKLHAKDDERLLVTFRAAKFRRHLRV